MIRERPFLAVERFLGCVARPGAYSILMELLRHSPEGMGFKPLQEATGFPPRTISRRLQELKALGLVEEERKDKQVPPWVRYYASPLLLQLAPALERLAAVEQESGALTRGVKRLAQTES